jgi:hypothetical protein
LNIEKKAPTPISDKLEKNSSPNLLITRRAPAQYQPYQWNLGKRNYNQNAWQETNDRNSPYGTLETSAYDSTP